MRVCGLVLWHVTGFQVHTLFLVSLSTLFLECTHAPRLSFGRVPAGRTVFVGGMGVEGVYNMQSLNRGGFGNLGWSLFARATSNMSNSERMNFVFFQSSSYKLSLHLFVEFGIPSISCCSLILFFYVDLHNSAARINSYSIPWTKQRGCKYVVIGSRVLHHRWFQGIDF